VICQRIEQALNSSRRFETSQLSPFAGCEAMLSIGHWGFNVLRLRRGSRLNRAEQAAMNAAICSLWLQDALAGEANDAPLVGDTRADIAIIGGGYVGLWTALRIKELEPSREIALVERDVCGSGASGRNGGFVLSWWAKFPSLVKLFGENEALRLVKASMTAIDEIGAFCAQNRIEAAFTQAGWLWTATSSAQMNAWESVVRQSERVGINAFDRLDPQEVARRSGSPVHRAGVLERRAATVQPAALVRGMRSVAKRRGVRIYEHTPVVRFSRVRPCVLRTPNGTLTADRVVVATNAWAAALPELSRSIAVISSDIIATAPIPSRLIEIGWTGAEAITDSQVMVCYYRTTQDGRIVFGKGGWGIAYGGNIGRNFDRDRARAALVASDFHRYYPMLEDVALTHDWCGPIDRSMDGLPLIGKLGGREHIAYGIGWSGNGVGPSVVGGRILASLALARDDEWSRSALVDRAHKSFPPEPIRYIGAHLVREAVMRKERAENAGTRPNWLAAAFATLAPAGLEDKD
jgi:putative aminophosphonate oxidoreductase